MPITNYFEKLNGVDVHYDRAPLSQYGSKGVPYQFHSTESFEDKLNKAFKELFELAGISQPEVIISAGALKKNFKF